MARMVPEGLNASEVTQLLLLLLLQEQVPWPVPRRVAISCGEPDALGELATTGTTMTVATQTAAASTIARRCLRRNQAGGAGISSLTTGPVVAVL